MAAKVVILAIFNFLFLSTIYSQTDTINTLPDTSYHQIDLEKLNKEKLTKIDRTGKSWIKKNPYKALIAPIGLISIGAVLIKNPVYDRFDFKNDLRDVFPNFRRTTVDDYLIYSPYVVLVGLNVVKIKCKNDFINTGLIILKSELINLSLTYALKNITAIKRPNGDPLAWPSGHTSEAFLAATIVNREFRYKSPWYGVAAYGLATTVGVFRMLNNKHWLSDVVAGAGLGIFSANVTYLTHQWKWGRPGSCLIPTFVNGSPGILCMINY